MFRIKRYDLVHKKGYIFLYNELYRRIHSSGINSITITEKDGA